jgi:hypothetical protein
MRDAPAALVEEVRRAEARAAERAALAAAAVTEAAERDASRSASVRRLMAGVFVGVTAVLVAGTLAVGPGEPIGYGLAFVLDAGFLLVSLVLLYATRARVLVNRWSRDAVGLFLVAALGTCLSHGVGWLRHDDLAQRGDSPTQVMFAVLFGVGSLLLSRRLLVPALVACLAALVSSLWPAISLLASAVTVVTAAVILAESSAAPRDAVGPSTAAEP